MLQNARPEGLQWGFSVLMHLRGRESPTLSYCGGQHPSVLAELCTAQSYLVARTEGVIEFRVVPNVLRSLPMCIGEFPKLRRNIFR
ncbi:hypothetical protein DF041_23770 [Burkholderia cepacia]|nr:hypothetical protein DF041_23770 [Burkholderia cepacia]